MVSGLDLFLGLFSNLAIFIVLVAVYSVVNSYLEKSNPNKRQTAMGVVFGLFAIACMYVKIPVAEGVIVDQRNAIVVLSGVFGGPISAALSATMAGLYRYSLGGTGVLGGVVGVNLAAVAGVILWYWRGKIDNLLKATIGAVTATIIILPGFLPVGDLHAGWALMKAMALPYGSAIFLGILLVGLLLDHEEHRRKAQVKLNVSEKRYRELFESLVDVVYRTDSQGNIVVVSPSLKTVFGYRPEEVEGKQMAKFYRDPAQRQEFIEQLRRDGHIENFEAEMRKKDGTLIWVSTNAKMLTDASGAFCGVEGVTRDISKIKKAEEDKLVLEKQLLQSQKMEAIGTLAGGVAHDFNNMLGAIMGYAELTLDEMDTANPLRPNIRQILDAARRSAGLTRQLLGFARKQTIAPVVLDLNEAVGAIHQMLRSLIGENIGLDWRPGTVPCKVKMDASQLDQILANLCVNARDAIPGVGAITIETSLVSFDEDYCASHAGFVPGEYVLLTVGDNGSGMDKETLDHIYEPFFTTKGVGRGTGLGLATVYGIVKQNDGFLNVYSEPGQGTIFKIYLPRYDTEAKAAGTVAVEDIQGSRGETVLIVEDDRILLEMGTTMLQRLGYTVLSASTPGEAIRLTQETSTDIHLFLTDVVMPKMNGRDLADRLQKIRPTIKHLFMSGYTTNVIAHQSVLDSGVNFIQKPFSLQALAAKLREVLDGSAEKNPRGSSPID